MKKIIIAICFITGLLGIENAVGQRRLEVGTVVKITGIGFIDENYSLRNKLINKTGTVTNKVLVNLGGAKDGVFNSSGPYGGEITIDGKPYGFLDVSIQVVKKDGATASPAKDLSKLSEGISTIVKAYFREFREYVSTSTYDDYNLQSFKSTYLLYGAEGRDKIYHYKSTRTWAFNTLFDINKISLAELKETLEKTTFDFGQLKALDKGPVSGWTYYIPKTKNGTDPKLKELTFTISIEGENFISFSIERNQANASK